MWCCCSDTWSCPTLCDPMDRSTPGLLSITTSRRSPKLMSIESVMPSNHLIFCRPLLLLPSVFPTIMVFSNEAALRIRGPKYLRMLCEVSSLPQCQFGSSLISEQPRTRQSLPQSPLPRCQWDELSFFRGSFERSEGTPKSGLTVQAWSSAKFK